MHESFAKATEFYGIAPVHAEKVWSFIEAQYTGPTRFYHNMDHILEMIDFISGYASIASELQAVILAAWYHDVIYDTMRNDNEEQSAFYARMSLEWMVAGNPDLLPNLMPVHVSSLVLCTKTHEPVILDEQLLCDADLFRFAGDFEKHSAQIRAEFSWVLDDDYRVGRNAVLQKFLNKDPLFHIPEVFNRFENLAKDNIKKGMV